MPRLTRLHADNIFRRLHYDQRIEPVTIVQGRNAAGKSSLLGLVRLAVNGPTAGNYPVLGDSAEYNWTCSATFDVGQISRWRTDDKHGCSFRGIGGALQQTQLKIEGTLGRAAGWSLDKFLELSPAKRLPFIEGEILGGTGWSSADTVERIRRRGGRPVQGAYSNGREMITSLLRQAQDTALRANADSLRLLGVTRQDALEAEADDLPSGTVAIWREKIRTLDAQLDDLHQQRGAAVARGRQAEVLAAEAEAVLTQITMLKRRDFDGQVDTARGLLEIGRARSEKMDAECSALEQTIAVLDADLETARRAFTAALEVYNAHDSELEVHARTRAAMAELQRPIGALRSMTEFVRALPHPRGDTPDRYDVVVEAEAALADLPPPAEAEVDRRPEMRATIDALREAVTAANNRRATTKLNLQAARVNAQILHEDIVKAERALARLEDERAARDTREAELTDAHRRTADALADLDGYDLEPIDALIAGLKAERAQATMNADRLTDAAGRIARREENSSALVRAQVTRGEARSEAALLTALLEEMLREIAQPFEAPISRITERVLGRAFRVKMDGGFDIELVDAAGYRVPFDTLNRSDRAVTMAALRLAIQQRLGGWRHLVIDDMENIDAERRTAFVDAMIAEVDAGRLDNFIGASVEDGWTPPAAAHTIRLERQ